MKRNANMIALLLAMAMSLSLCACTAGSHAQQTETPAPTEAAQYTSEPRETTVPAETEEAVSGRVSVTFETEREVYYDDADPGQELLSYASVLPRVRLDGAPEVEERINSALLEHYRLFVEGDEDSEGLSGRDAFLAAAREDLAARREYGGEVLFGGYSLERSIAVTRCDDRVLSLSFSDYTYTGGAHGYVLTTGLSFDLATGGTISLRDLAEDGAAFRDLCSDMLWERSRSGENTVYALGGYYDDYEQYLPGLLREGNWYFDDEGLTVLANPYELAPYAAGLITITLPYEWLRWQIREGFAPDEAQPDGVITGDIYQIFDGADFELDDGTDGQGASVVLTAEGAVEGFTVRRADYWEYSGRFTEGETLFYASRLGDGETLLLRTWIPDAAPNLMFTYRAGGVERRCLITQSGYDGSLILLDADAHAPLPLEITDRVPFDYDVDGDGEREVLDLVNTGGEDMPVWQVTVDGRPLARMEMTVWEPALWLADLDYDGVSELILSGDMGSDDFVTCAWRGDTLAPIPFTGESRRGADPAAQTAWAYGMAVFSVGNFYLESWSYQLGTYTAVREYALSEGVIAPAENSWSTFSGWSYSRNRIWLTLTREVPVTTEQGGTSVLSAGEEILLTGTDGARVYFRTRGGAAGSFTAVLGENGGWVINGVSEEETFEFLPYAG